VTRKDPAATNGTVTVDVSLIGELPRGAVPDLTVDGTVQLARLDNVLYVGRPAVGQEQSTVSLFRVENANGDASRVQVALGRSSVNAIEVKSGLQEGDRVVLSDMSTWDGRDRVRLK
jgi:HlyD family secretion protein